MTIRNRHELGIIFANAFHHSEGPLAILGMQDGTAPKYTAYATGELAPATNTRTPIVNLFQGAAEQRINSSSRDVYCSYVPTAACFGIMRMSRARAAYFIHNNLPCCVVIGAAGPVPTVANAVALPNAKADKLARDVLSVVPLAANWYVGVSTAVQAAAAAWVDEIIVPSGVNDTAKAVSNTVNMIGPLTGVDHIPAFELAVPATTQQAVRAVYRDELFMSLVRVLASVTWIGTETDGTPNVDLRRATGVNTLASGKNIAALLVANDTKIIGWGINTNDANGTRHAETNAIQAFQKTNGTALPQTVRLYSTLQPCFMCAGLYSHAGGSDCLYDQTDPGMVNNTALAGTERTYLGVFTATSSFGAALDASNRLAIQHGNQVRAPDYLQSQPAAGIYCYSIQRFVTLGMKAQGGGETQLWSECLKFLKEGPLGPIMQRPDLFLID